MRNPARKALLFGALAAIGATLVWFGADRHAAVGEAWTSILPIVIGMAVAPIALVLFLQASLHIRGQAKLLAGRARLADWHLSADEWDRFRTFDEQRALSDLPRLVNDLSVHRRTPARGVDVIVGEKSLMVDESYHVLRPRGLPELRGIGWLDNAAVPGRPPDCLEFELAYPRGRHGGVQLMTLRVPFPREAHGKALAVYEFFAPRLVRKPGIALRNPRRTYQVLAVLLAACLAAFAAGWTMAEASDWRADDSMLPVVLLIVGVAGAAFSLVLGVLTFLLALRKD